MKERVLQGVESLKGEGAPPPPQIRPWYKIHLFDMFKNIDKMILAYYQLVSFRSYLDCNVDP